jgi:glycogen debranching enzyme
VVLKSLHLFYVPEWADGATARAGGLWARDTRHLLPVTVESDGNPLPVTGSEERGDHATVVYGDGTVEATVRLNSNMTWDLRVARGRSCSVVLDSDFADIFELRGCPARPRGRILPPTRDSSGADLAHEAPDGHRRTTRVRFPTGVAARVEGASLRLTASESGEWGFSVAPDYPFGTGPRRPTRIRVATGDPDLDRLLDRSFADLETLTTEFPDGVLPAAGVPWYVAPFGRDVLITAWQTMWADPDGAVEALRTLARIQGTKTDPMTGEEPGKIIHEARYGELARLGAIPQRPYYGSVDATPLFLLVAAETLLWTGDRSLYEELQSAIRAALRWIDGPGDLDGDGLVEYSLEPDPRLVPPLNARHQAWKDSDDSLHHRDGTEPLGPVAPVEAQGYTHLAMLRLAEVAGWIGDQAAKRDFLLRAGQLARRIDPFWLPDDHWYAQALDGEKRPVASIASNGAQLLFTGAVPAERAALMARRLGEHDLDSRWGIRTLSSAMPHYDPLSYHNGSVWPHDNGIIADGCYRTGHADVGHRIFEAMVRAALVAPGGSLAELHGGREEQGAPLEVPLACRPQAWAAGTLPGLIRSALGLSADPTVRVLTVTPTLPPFIERVEIEEMSVFGKSVDLRVDRSGNSYEVAASGVETRLGSSP